MSLVVRLAKRINPARLIRRSLIWRYTLLFSLITLTLVGILLAVLYHQSIGNVVKQQQRDLDLQSVQQREIAGGMSREAYVDLLNRHNRSSSSTLLVLENTHGALSFIPESLTHCPNLKDFPVWNDDAGHIQKQQGCVTKTPHGKLLVSLDTAPLERIREQFLSALVLVSSAAVLLSLLLGWLFSSRVLRRLKEINQLCATLTLGQNDSKSRLPISRRGDEFDTTVSHINQMLDAIDSSVEQIAGVTDTIAHDLRTPLSRLRIHLERLMDQVGNPASEELGVAIAELDAVLSAFQAMLELTRLEQQQRNTFNTEDLTRIVNDAIELAEPLLETQKQTLETEVVENCTVFGDADLLFRMCFNLLENASKYAGRGAVVTVLLRPDQLIVSDNGPGVPDADLDKVLRRFYRVDESRAVPGHGLGLSFVRAICRLHRMALTLSDNHPGLRVSIRFGE